MTIRKAQHWLETPHPTKLRQRTRKIQNYLHFKEDDQAADWEDSNPGADIATGIPDGWPGTFDYDYYSRKGALQCALGKDGIDRPHIHLRIANRREIHVKYVWLGGDPVTLERVNRRIRFLGYGTNTRLVYIIGRHRINSEIRLSDTGHPASFRFQLRLAPGMSYEFTNDIIILKDDQGDEVMRLPPPIGRDSSTVSPTLDGQQIIQVNVNQTLDVNGHPTFRWIPNTDDLSTAVYPVVIS